MIYRISDKIRLNGANLILILKKDYTHFQNYDFKLKPTFIFIGFIEKKNKNPICGIEPHFHDSQANPVITKQPSLHCCLFFCLTITYNNVMNLRL